MCELMKATQKGLILNPVQLSLINATVMQEWNGGVNKMEARLSSKRRDLIRIQREEQVRTVQVFSLNFVSCFL